MSRRFYVETLIDADTAMLTGNEAHHLIHVMRAKAGDEIVLFDGSGAEFPARVDQLGRSEVSCEILSRNDVDCELPFELTLGVALPKGDRQRWLIEKATELGVTSFVPLVTERGVAQPTDKALDRLRRAVIEASKQCGRNRLMQIRQPTSFHQFVEHTGNELCVIAMPGENSSELPTNQSMRIAVGPEGGFSGNEFQTAIDAGCRPFNLGPRILRTETAAIAMATIVATA